MPGADTRTRHRAARIAAGWPPVVGTAGPRRRGRHRRRRHRRRRVVRRHRAVLWVGEGGGDRRRGHPRPPGTAADPHQVRNRPRSQHPVDGRPQPRTRSAPTSRPAGPASASTSSTPSRSTIPTRDADRDDMGVIDGAGLEWHRRRRRPLEPPGRAHGAGADGGSDRRRPAPVLAARPRRRERRRTRLVRRRAGSRSSPGRRWPAASSSTTSTSRRRTPQTCVAACAGHPPSTIAPNGRGRPSKPLPSNTTPPWWWSPLPGSHGVPACTRSSGRGTPLRPSCSAALYPC